MGSLGTTRPATSTCLDEARAARWPSHPGAGSSGGFESEVLPHLPALRRLATRFVDAIVDADDLIQETMLRACRGWDQYEPGTNVRAWLMTIMRNYYVNLTGRLSGGLSWWNLTMPPSPVTPCSRPAPAPDLGARC